MEVRMNYFNDYGLTGPVDPTSENGILNEVTYIFLLNRNGYYKNQPTIEFLNTHVSQFLDNSEVEPGLYNRNPYLLTRTTSNDNLTAIMAWSCMYQTSHRYEVWRYLLKHCGTYDNTQGKSKQLSRLLPFNPGNYFIWGLMADSYLAYLFLPFYLINLIIACNKPVSNTSTKILHWVGLYALTSLYSRNKLIRALYEYYEGRMEKMYGISYLRSLMTIFHGGQGSDFPINKIFAGDANG